MGTRSISSTTASSSGRTMAHSTLEASEKGKARREKATSTNLKTFILLDTSRMASGTGVGPEELSKAKSTLEIGWTT